MTLITDGLPAYYDAYKKEFWPLKNPRTEHIRNIIIRGDRNNNKMERFNGEIRDGEKTMRGLKKWIHQYFLVIKFSTITLENMKD